MQKDITVDFPIEWNRENGRMKVSTFKKVVKHLIEKKMLRKGCELFIHDANRDCTFWCIASGESWGSWFNYAVSVEFTEDETAKECDWFNCLYFDKKRGGAIGEYSFESYRV